MEIKIVELTKFYSENEQGILVNTEDDKKVEFPFENKPPVWLTQDNDSTT